MTDTFISKSVDYKSSEEALLLVAPIRFPPLLYRQITTVAVKENFVELPEQHGGKEVSSLKDVASLGGKIIFTTGFATPVSAPLKFQVPPG